MGEGPDTGLGSRLVCVISWSRGERCDSDRSRTTKEGRTAIPDSREEPRPQMDAHARRDDEKLRLHRAVARRLLLDPERVLAIARDNLRRWRLDHAAAPYYEEWDEILRTRSVHELAEILVADSEDARRLRQNTPFVGVIPREERDAIFGGGEGQAAGANGESGPPS